MNEIPDRDAKKFPDDAVEVVVESAEKKEGTNVEKDEEEKKNDTEKDAEKDPEKDAEKEAAEPLPELEDNAQVWQSKDDRKLEKKANVPLDQSQDPRKRKILVTGHSLGGAMATIAALEIKKRYDGEYIVEMINIASPRFGNHRFASWFNKEIPGALRVVFDRDVVPGIPKFCCLYEHVGHEVFIDAKGNALVDRAPIEKHFVRGGKTKLSTHKIPSYRKAVSAHMEKYLPKHMPEVSHLFKKVYPPGYHEKKEDDFKENENQKEETVDPHDDANNMRSHLCCLCGSG